MNVVVVRRHVVDSWNVPPPEICAVAIDIEAAKQWIQDEVDHKHDYSNTYMQGKNADWWIEYGIFSLLVVEVVGR